MKTTATLDYTTRKLTHVSFENHDEKGRTIGANIIYATGQFVADDSSGWHFTAPAGAPTTGPAYFMEVHATRSRADFGACQPWQVFATEAEREAARDKYLDSARKRAAKRAPK